MEELRRLRYFIAVADHLNFRQAADALRTSQPSLSQQIQALENELGVELFERNKRHVRLTNAGAEVLLGARQAVADFDAGARRARDAESGVRGTIAVGSAGMAMIDYLPNVVRAFKEAVPDAHVTLSIIRNPELVTALRDGHIELAIGALVEPDDRICTQVLWTCQSLVVLPSDHRLASRPSVELTELDGETLIVHPHRAGSDANAWVLALCRELRFAPGSVFEVAAIAELESLIGLVACGFGITILPAPFEVFKSPSVVFKPITGNTRIVSVSAAWRAGHAPALVRHFVEVADRVGKSFVPKIA